MWDPPKSPRLPFPAVRPSPPPPESGLANTSFLDEPSTNFTLLISTDKALRDYVQALPPQLRGHLPSPLLQALDIKPGVRGVLTAELLPVGRTFLQVHTVCTVFNMAPCVQLREL